MMTAQAIAEMIENHRTANHWATSYGLRDLPASQENMNVGDELPNSYAWEDQGDHELNGSSTIGISYPDEDTVQRALDILTGANYNGNRIALVAGTGRTEGWDDGEWIISQAEIVAIIN